MVRLAMSGEGSKAFFHKTKPSGSLLINSLEACKSKKQQGRVLGAGRAGDTAHKPTAFALTFLLCVPGAALYLSVNTCQQAELAVLACSQR